MTEKIQEAFDERVLSVDRFDPGYANSNDVWFVVTEAAEFVLKISGHEAQTPESSFWSGLRCLFGCRPNSEIEYRQSLSKLLNNLGEKPVPKPSNIVRSKIPFGSSYIIEPRMPGAAVPYGSVHEQRFVSDTRMMRQFGRNIAKMHGPSFVNLRNYPETTVFPAQQFPTRLARTIELLVSRFWMEDAEIAGYLAKYIRAIRQMPLPKCVSLVMPDMTPCQFLTDDGRISSLVDIESYVRGLIELELAAIELWMVDADAFLRGYQEVAGLFPESVKNFADFSAFRYFDTKIVVRNMIRRECQGLLHGGLNLDVSPAGGFRIVMFG